LTRVPFVYRPSTTSLFRYGYTLRCPNDIPYNVMHRDRRAESTADIGRNAISQLSPLGQPQTPRSISTCRFYTPVGTIELSTMSLSARPLSRLCICEYASFSTGRNLSSSSPRSADARLDARPSSAPPHSAMAPCPGAVPSTRPTRRPPSALCRARALLGGGNGGRRRHVDGASHVPHAYRVVPRTT